MTLAQAQEAKLDLICRKLALKPGKRFLDAGAGWGALLVWAAEHYGADATGITPSKNLHAYVQRLVKSRGLEGRVRVELLDYRNMDASRTFDKIASVGMFEHVGHANMVAHFKKVCSLLKPGGQVLRDMAHSGLEMVDTENLRPHYARTLWAWSDALEAQLDAAQRVRASRSNAARSGKIQRAYRLYPAGSAMSFEQGWISLHQMLAVRPTGDAQVGIMPGAQSAYPFNRSYIYR
jgi:cyclopropane-fatty-acyl-phospholipid synthase